METVWEWLEYQEEQSLQSSSENQRWSAISDFKEKLEELYDWKKGPPPDNADDDEIFQVESGEGLRFIISIEGSYYEYGSVDIIDISNIYWHRRVMRTNNERQ